VLIIISAWRVVTPNAGTPVLDVERWAFKLVTGDERDMKIGFNFHDAGPFELNGNGSFVTSHQNFVPAYVEAFEKGILQRRADEAVESLRSCRVCPRDCEIDRFNNKIGVCKSGRLARVASAFPHFGEEDCLRGWNGSGTIFFGWCNLRCVFCQNFETSQFGEGAEVTAAELAAIMLDLQGIGCHNINFVTPEHVVPQILEALAIAVEQGLRLPLVYNTSAYDSIESLQWMDGIVDIYMPDFKLWDPEHCRKYLVASDYAEAACTVIAAMHAQVGELKVDENGLALRGVLVRHLVMPSLLDDTREIMRWIAENLSRDTYVNVMDQYYPAHKAETEPRFTEINRGVSVDEFCGALELARDAGLWRLDTRWRNVIPHGAPVWLPQMRGRNQMRAEAI
jgi:putative pyruvate formate lyase activating enzyme